MEFACIIFPVFVIKKQTYTKAETCILYSRVFRQMSSKSILIISTYTVSKLAHFLRYSVVSAIINKKALLSQGEPRDAAVNFDTYRILQ